MIRRVITSGVLAAGSLAGLALAPSPADAQPPPAGPAYPPTYDRPAGPEYRWSHYPPGGHDRVEFQVLVRHPGH